MRGFLTLKLFTARFLWAGFYWGLYLCISCLDLFSESESESEESSIFFMNLLISLFLRACGANLKMYWSSSGTSWVPLSSIFPVSWRFWWQSHGQRRCRWFSYLCNPHRFRSCHIGRSTESQISYKGVRILLHLVSFSWPLSLPSWVFFRWRHLSCHWIRMNTWACLEFFSGYPSYASCCCWWCKNTCWISHRTLDNSCCL